MIKEAASNSAKWHPIVLLLLLLVAANAAALCGGMALLRLAGGVVLFCLLPGWALVAWLLPGEPLLERLLLALGSSYALANLTVLALHAVPGPLDVLTLCLALDALTLLLTLAALLRCSRGAFGPRLEERESGAAIVVAFVALMMLAAFFRFANLGHSEFQGDEVGVLTLAERAIWGDDDALSLHRKGPAEITTALAFGLFTNGFDEFALRVPFALAGLGSVLVVYVIGQQLFGETAGWAAGALLSLEGVYLGYSRIVQYQGIILLMQTMAFHAFYRYLRAEDEGEAVRFQLLGTFFFAFGCLAHYDVVPVGGALALLYLARGWWRARWRQVVTLAGALAIALAILAPFYVPFFFAAGQSGTRAYIFAETIGGGAYNHLPDFLAFALFYNSVWYVALMGLMLGIAWLAALWAGVGRRRPLFYTAVASLPLAFGLMLFVPEALTGRGINYSFMLFLPATLGVLLGCGLAPELRASWLWFLAYFIVYSFLFREPGLHQNAFSPAWALLAGAGVSLCLQALGGRAQGAAFGLFVALLALFAGYDYLFFIQSEPEYAMTFPRYVSWLYPTPLKEVPRCGRFGVPRLAGWETTAWLYRTGVLRGGYDTNERARTPDWYMRSLRDDVRPPRYVFFNPNVRPGDKSWKGTRESIERFYTLWGEVTVGRRTGLLIYEDRNFFAGGPPVRYALEDYAPRYDVEITSLAAWRRRLQINDDRDVQAVGAFLEVVAKPGDVLVLVGPELAEALSYYYRGDLPYYPLPQGQPLDESETAAELEAILAEHDVVYGLFWATGESDPQGFIEGWLDQHAYKITERWFANLRLALYTSALMEARGEHYLQDLRLGQAVELLAYEVDGLPVGPGDVVDLTLYWAAWSEMEEDYTVFTHLIDAEDRVWAQQDNPPQEGERPTSGWREGEVVADSYHLLLPDDIPAGQYRLEVGMYHWQTGERLSLSQGDQETDNRVLLAPQISVE